MNRRSSYRRATARLLLFVAALLAWVPSIATAGAPPPAARDLRVESVSCPVAGVGVARPRFGWVATHPERDARQTAYRVTVAEAAPPSMAAAAAAAEAGRANSAIVWDSGTVASNATIGVQCGADLASDKTYTVTVVWTDHNGVAAPPATGAFTTALLNQSDWAASQWLTVPDNAPDNQLRATLAIPEDRGPVQRGTCFVSGLGYHRTWLNGQRLVTGGSGGEGEGSEQTLGYFAQFQRRLPYDTFDVTALLRPGNNTLAVLLGRGWWALPEDDFTHVLGYRRLGNRSLRVLCRVSFAANNAAAANNNNGGGGGDGDDDETVLTFASGSATWPWRLGAGELQADHLFLGPRLDKTRATPGWNQLTTAGFDDSAWALAQPAPPGTAPVGAMASFVAPPVRRHEPRAPVGIQRVNASSYVLDFAVNQAMQCELRIEMDGTQAPGAVVLRLLHDEQVDANGEVIISNNLGGVADQTTFVLDGSAGVQTFDTVFSYFGARFVQIVGWPSESAPTADTMTCYFVHTALPSQSSIQFSTRDVASQLPTDSATILAGVHDITMRSALSNFMSTPTDCPSREKRGWTGDGQAAAETLIYNFDMSAAYPKWLGDIAHAQQCNFDLVPRPECPVDAGPFCRQPGDGSIVTEMAPYLFGGALNACAGGSDPAWGSGYIAIVDWVHRYYADAQVARHHYANAVAYVDALQAAVNASSRPDNALLDLTYTTTRYGDWCSAAAGVPQARATSNLINGFYYLKQVGIVAGLAANVAGDAAAAAAWRTAFARGVAQFNRLYLSSSSSRPVGYADVECPTPGDRSSQPCHASIDGVVSAQTLQALPLALGLPPTPADEAAVGAALAAAVENGTYPGRTDTGLVGTKYVLPALVATGRPDLALRIATATDFPSWGHMLPPSVHPDGQGEGTLWERWEGSLHAGSGSRNHIMLGGFDGPYFFGNLAGLRNDGAAWSDVTVAPTVAGDLAGVAATVHTLRGPLAVNWAAGGGGAPVCGMGHELDDKSAKPAVVDCGAGATIANVTFANYGGTQPGGTCGNWTPTCSSGSSMSIVRAACLGKQNCSVDADPATFPGPDPCPGQSKQLVVQVVCHGTAFFTLALDAPVGSTTTVHLPLLNGTAGFPRHGALPGRTAETVVVQESGATIWAGGSFVPGAAPGVREAVAVSSREGSVVAVTVGAGSYSFAMRDATAAGLLLRHPAPWPAA